jgi:hypothetical protein
MTQQAYHSQPAAQPSTFVPFTPEQRASFLAYRFGSTLDWSSRILVEINYPVEELRWFVDAVQGICKGKEQRIAHATLAIRAQRFKNPGQAKSLAKRAIVADREWSRLHRRMVFDIESPKPGEKEGKDKRARTRYTDYLTPACVWAQEAEGRAKKSDEVRWKKDPKHRFAERQRILAAAVEMLPTFECVEDMPLSAQPKDPNPLSISEYVQQRKDRLLAENERVLARLSEGELIDTNEIDDRIAALEAYYNQVRGEIIKKFQSTRHVLEGLKLTRCVRAMNLGDVDETPAHKGYAHDPLMTPPLSGKDSYKGVAHVPLSDPPVETVSSEFEEIVEPPEIENSEPTPDCRAAAQMYAARGIPVFPCKLDKSPQTPNGFKNATANNEQVANLWRRKPEASIGIPTGSPSGFIVLDVDTDKGGDASLTVLDERIGGLPPTMTARSGSGGIHLYYKVPEGVEIRNSAGRLGVGLDIRGEGGYIIAAPSPHPSGGTYQWTSFEEPAPFPQALIEILNSPQHKPIETDYAPRRTALGGTVIPDGERNERLFKIGCALWGKGEARDFTDLHHQLLDVNARRCVPALDDAEVAKLVANIAARYARGTPIKDSDDAEDYSAYFDADGNFHMPAGAVESEVVQ